MSSVPFCKTRSKFSGGSGAPLQSTILECFASAEQHRHCTSEYFRFYRMTSNRTPHGLWPAKRSHQVAEDAPLIYMYVAPNEYKVVIYMGQSATSSRLNYTYHCSHNAQRRLCIQYFHFHSIATSESI